MGNCTTSCCESLKKGMNFHIDFVDKPIDRPCPIINETIIDYYESHLKSVIKV